MLEYNLDFKKGSYYHIQNVDEFGQAFPFYVSEFGFIRAGKMYFTRRDKFEHYLLIFTVSGAGRMEWHGGSATLMKGDIAVVDCRDFQYYFTLKENWEFYYLHFNGAGMKAYDALRFSVLTPVHFGSEESVLARFSEIDSMIDKTDPIKYAKQSHAVSWILTAMAAAAAGKPEKSEKKEMADRPDISSLAAYIRNHCTEDLSTGDFARYINLSNYHMNRLFAAHMGMPPYRYMHNCRIKRAQQLLMHSTLQSAEIAESVGYKNYVLFGRHFRQFTGISPSEFRNRTILAEKELEN